MSKEKDLLQLDAQSKLVVISDLISDNNNLMAEVDELTRWKNEALLTMKNDKQEILASDVLTQKIIDLEEDVDRYRAKYQKSMKALEGMEEALLVRSHDVELWVWNFLPLTKYTSSSSCRSLSSNASNL